MSDTIKNLLENLESNPIFRMSLTSKELFHSNFWAWMIEAYPETLKVFYPDYDEKKEGKR